MNNISNIVCFNKTHGFCRDFTLRPFTFAFKSKSVKRVFVSREWLTSSIANNVWVDEDQFPPHFPDFLQLLVKTIHKPAKKLVGGLFSHKFPLLFPVLNEDFNREVPEVNGQEELNISHLSRNVKKGLDVLGLIRLNIFKKIEFMRILSASDFRVGDTVSGMTEGQFNLLTGIVIRTQNVKASRGRECIRIRSIYDKREFNYTVISIRQKGVWELRTQQDESWNQAIHKGFGLFELLMDVATLAKADVGCSLEDFIDCVVENVPWESRNQLDFIIRHDVWPEILIPEDAAFSQINHESSQPLHNTTIDNDIQTVTSNYENTSALKRELDFTNISNDENLGSAKQSSLKIPVGQVKEEGSALSFSEYCSLFKTNPLSSYDFIPKPLLHIIDINKETQKDHLTDFSTLNLTSSNMCSVCCSTLETADIKSYITCQHCHRNLHKKCAPFTGLTITEENSEVICVECEFMTHFDENLIGMSRDKFMSNCMKCVSCLRNDRNLMLVSTSNHFIWVHAFCSQFLPRESFLPNRKLNSTVLEMARIKVKKKACSCELCGLAAEDGGIPIKCSFKHCSKYIHSYCALISACDGTVNQINTNDRGNTSLYCLSHSGSITAGEVYRFLNI